MLKLHLPSLTRSKVNAPLLLVCNGYLGILSQL